MRAVIAMSLSLSALCAPLVWAQSYEYDALGRVVSTTYPDGKQVRYSYDAAGNRIEVAVSQTTANLQPAAEPDAISVAEGGSAQIDPRTNDTDPESQALTIVGVGTPGLGSVAITGSGSGLEISAASGSMPVDGPASLTFTYTIADTLGATATGAVTVTVTNANPVAMNDTVAEVIPRGGIIYFDPRANDTDSGGDEISIQSVTNGQRGVVTVLNSGTEVSYRANSGQAGTDSFSYTIADGDGGSATGTVTVSIYNQTPVANADTLTTTAGVVQTFNPRTNDSDPDGDTFTITAATNGSKGTVTVGSGGTSVTYTPAAGQTGADSFTYTITDAFGASATASVSVTINSSNHPPVAVNDYMTVAYIAGACRATSFSPKFNDTDADGDPLTITWATQGTKGNVTRTTSLVTYTPTTLARHGTDSFTYTISDGQGGTATGTIYATCDFE